MILHEGKPLSLLNVYSDERRKVFQTFVSPTSTANKLRIQQDPAAADNDWLVRSLKKPTPVVLHEFFTPYMTVWRTDMRAVVASHGVSEALSQGENNGGSKAEAEVQEEVAHLEQLKG
jgi:hypothetical protein